MGKEVSIIIPCYNVENYIDRCFAGLYNQSLGFDNIELIFVDDASTDNTLSIIMSYEMQYPDNIIVIQLKEHHGMGFANNTGLNYASAPYVSFVYPDCFVESTMFDKMLSYMEQYSCDFVECGWDLASDETHHFSIRKQGDFGLYDLQDYSRKEHFIRTHLGNTAVWNKLFDRCFLLENDIFCLEQSMYEGMFFCYLAFLYAKKCYRIDETLYHCKFSQKSSEPTRTYLPKAIMKSAVDFLHVCRSRESLYIDSKTLIDWMFVERYYIYSLWEIFSRIPEQSYIYYREMKSILPNEIVDYKSNQLLQSEDNTFDNIMLKLLDIDLDEPALIKLRDKLVINCRQNVGVTLPDVYESTNRYYAESAMPDAKSFDATSNAELEKTVRILFCIWNSVCDKAVEHGFRQLGCGIELMLQYLENMNNDMNYYDSLKKRLTTRHFDYVFTVDFLPIVSRCCNDLNVPYICWMIDHPVNELYSEELRLPCNRLFYFDRYQYELFARRNPENSFYMPLACDYDTLSSVSLDNNDHMLYDCDISFVGSTYEEKCEYNLIERILPQYYKGFSEGIINAQYNVYGYNFIADILSDDYCKELAKYSSLIKNISDDEDDIRTIIADSYIGRKCTEYDRITTLKIISEKYNLDLYTTSDVIHFPAANCKGSVDYNAVMPKIFKCSKINLNMTSRSIHTGIPLRVFDIMGSGGFLLSNYQSEINDYFEVGKDLAVYESQADMIYQIDYYLNHEDLRREIAHNGEMKVKKYHTFTIRLEKILSIVADSKSSGRVL